MHSGQEIPGYERGNGQDYGAPDMAAILRSCRQWPTRCARSLRTGRMAECKIAGRQREAIEGCPECCRALHEEHEQECGERGEEITPGNIPRLACVAQRQGEEGKNGCSGPWFGQGFRQAELGSDSGTIRTVAAMARADGKRAHRTE